MMKRKIIIIISVILLIIVSLFLNNDAKKANTKGKYIAPLLGDIGDGVVIHSNVISFSNIYMASKNVQTAVDELYTSIDDGCEVYYSKSSTNGGTYACSKRSDGANQDYQFDSSFVRYNNGLSGLQSEYLDAAIVEVSDKIPTCKEGYLQDNVSSNSYNCKKECKSPEDITIGTDKTLSWTNADGASSYQACVVSGEDTCTPDTTVTNGSIYNVITSEAGSRTVFLRSVCNNTFYTATSDTEEITTSVNSVTLSTNGNGFNSITGAGNYIEGAEVTITANVKNGYTWNGWYDDEENLISSSLSYTSTIDSDWNYTASATPNEYTLSPSDNLFAGTTQISNGVTATYDEANSYLTLNGTGSTTNFISELWNLERRSFTEGEQYRVTITYVSGSYSLVNSSQPPRFVIDLTTNGALFGDRNDSPATFFDSTLPTSGSTTSTYTVNASRTNANGLRYWLWQQTENNTTFNNYQVQILITKVQDKTITFGDTYGELETPTKTGYDFVGWYTAMTGGTEVTSASTYNVAGNQTIYTRWTSHKLNIQYNGNGSSVTWCGTNAAYDMDSSKYAIYSSNSSRNITTHAYGQYIHITSGLANYNNATTLCFSKNGYTAKDGAQLVLSTDSTKTYDQDDATVSANTIATDAGCNLQTTSVCTAQMNVNWKDDNPMTMVTPQSWHPMASTSIQEYDFDPPNNAQGTVTYAITSQTPGNYFSIPTSNEARIRMAANTPSGTSYTITLTANDSGNANYMSASGTFTLNVIVSVGQCNPPTGISVSSNKMVTWTASSNCATATYNACVVTGTGTCVPTSTELASGGTLNAITDEAGTRTVCIKSVSHDTYYADSDPACASTTVYTVTLSPSPSAAFTSLSGGGNFITGATTSISATVADGYTWTNWTGSSTTTSNPASITVDGNKSYTANATGNTYTLNYVDNLFAGTSQVTNGVTATFTENGSYLTLNGTTENANFFINPIWNYETRSFAVGDQYKITLNYVSGSLTKADSSKTARFYLELAKSGAVFSDRTTDPVTYKVVSFPESGSTTGTFTVGTGRNTATGLLFRLHDQAYGNVTFNDYKVQIIVTKVHSKSVTYGSAIGSLNTPTKTGYDFDGWYTAMTGGTQVTSSDIYNTLGNQTVYARWTPHKLYIKYNGNGSAVTWCGTGTTYSMDSSKYAILQSNSSRDVTVRGYGQYISPTGGLINYNNSAAVCFAKEGYAAKASKHWVLSSDSTKTYDHTDATLTAIDMASDAGCNLKTTASCSIRLNVNWKGANPITVTASQSWGPTFSTSAQTKTFTAASNAQGAVTYAIQSQPSGSYFSIPDSSTNSLKMKASTPAGTYSVKIRATAAGNSNYISGYKDITMTVTVGKATPTLTVSDKSVTYNCKGNDMTYKIKSNVAGTFSISSSSTTNATVSPTSKSASANTNYTITVSGKKSAAVTITNSFTPTSSNYKSTSTTVSLSEGKWKGTGAGKTGNTCSTAGYASCTDSGVGINWCCMNNCAYPGYIMTSSCTCVAA